MGLFVGSVCVCVGGALPECLKGLSAVPGSSQPLSQYLLNDCLKES